MNKKILFGILCFIMLSVAVNAAIPQEKLAARKANSQGTIFFFMLKENEEKQIIL